MKLPNFKIESGASLEGSLRLLGVEDTFDEKKANFSSMSVDALRPGRRLYMSEMVHKAFIEVNEERTEAAAATE